MTTYIVRHGQTDYSARYLVNGDPSRPLLLTEDGQAAVHSLWSVLPLHRVRTWLSSEFPRARQTATLLMGIPSAEPVIDSRLNELDYGEFEGGPFLEYAAWLERHGADELPPKAAESQREGIRRMLTGLRDALELPGPRVLVGHGLLVSVLLWHQDRPSDETMPLFFPEAPCAQPLPLSDEELLDTTTRLLAELDGPVPRASGNPSGALLAGLGDGPAVATVGPVIHPPETKDPRHA